MKLKVEVDRRTVGERVAAALRSHILTGELTPGQRLTEADLVASLGVSRGPVREALRQLVGEGLLVYQPNRGISVWRPTAKEIWELATLRAAIEGMAVRVILLSGRRDGLLVRLCPLVEAFTAADARADRSGTLRTDAEFHGAIVAAAGNQRMYRLWTGTDPLTWLAAPDRPRTGRPMAGPHRQLVERIAAGTPQEAQEAVIEHILEGRYFPEGDTVVE